MTRDLLVVQPVEKVGNSGERSLAYMADRLKKKMLSTPDFQREWCWDDAKLKGWIETVISGEAIGVLVTYQIVGDGDSPKYIADGLQRLTATNKFLDNPAKYGFSFGEEQAREYCENFMIPIQHRHYKDHDDALRAFQALNKGTALEPGEFYKGTLTLNSDGETLYREIPAIVERYETPLLDRADLNALKRRDKRLMAIRGSLALFLQYISGTNRLLFWNTATRRLSGKEVIEQELINYIKENKPDIEKEIKNFKEYTAEHFATINHMIKETGDENKPMTLTTSRYLFHMNIWRRNSKRSVAQYLDFVRHLFGLLKPFPTYRTRFTLPETIPAEIVSLKADSIGGTMKRLCEYFAMQDFYGGKVRPKQPSRAGYDVSHLQPFSMFGDGETFLEPSQINRARGAEPVQVAP